MTLAEVRRELTSKEILALTLFGEARGESLEGLCAVAAVIRNRVAQPERFGETYAAVCLAKSQFSCWWKFGGEMNNKLVMDVALWIRRGMTDASPLGATGRKQFERCLQIANLFYNGTAGHSLVGLATHYYAPMAMVPKNAVPDWAKDLPFTVVGNHRFYAGVK